MLDHLHMPGQTEDVPPCASGDFENVQAAQAKEVGHRSSFRKKGKTPKALWNVVWCHEHCHKASNAALAQALQEAVKDVGAACVCCKKANGYMSWLEDQRSRPHVLITNWREVKPTVQGLAEAGSCCRPLGIIVLAESDVVHRRASQWTETLSDIRIPVLLETAIEPLKALLASFNKEVFHEETQMPQAPLWNVQPLPEKSQAGGIPLTKSPPLSLPLSKNGAQQMQKTFKDSLPISTVNPSSMEKLTDPDETEKSTSACARPAVPQHHLGIHPGSLLAFLTEAVKNQHTAGRIQQDLLQNMPEVYED
eukprot:TRINITY_DN104555_c0_g1_i1.p1 TRINITY_DN104555_c0_g1~~TRINITY_DN104555_c0_g1_i1.p1  ORF type:complete len:308 (-),score=65.78 TRINITY_DN104555_c0_g1_i1:288-1211(-)